MKFRDVPGGVERHRVSTCLLAVGMKGEGGRAKGEGRCDAIRACESGCAVKVDDRGQVIDDG